MIGSTFLTLLRTDWRVYRVTIGSAVVIGLVPYVASTVASAASRSDVLAGRVARSLNLAHTVGDAAIVSVGLTVLLAMAFGGMSFAAERRDRSAEFLTLLPPRRLLVVASKAVVAVACIAAAFAAHAAAWRWAAHLLDRSGQGVADGRAFGCVCATAGMGFGLAWCLSSVLNSPSISAVIAGGTVAVAAFALNQAGAFNGSADEAVTNWDQFAALVGSVAFTAGSVVAVVRVRP